jgi:alpha-methylacyl-CoA racemase
MTAAPPRGPLAGVEVIELAAIGPAPFAGRILGELGAHVTRIDRPVAADSQIPAEMSRVNRDKTSVTLDLKTPAGVEGVLDLVDGADALLESHRPGVLERLGLGPAVLLERNPRLVIGRMTGWGQDGPLSQAAGHDVNYIGVTGALHAIGAADGPPAIPLNLVGDYGGGALYLALGVVAALYEVRGGGNGQVVDAAVVDGVLHMLSGVQSALDGGLWRDERGANFMDGGRPLYAVYRTADDRYMSVSAVERPFYLELLRMLQLDFAPEARTDSAQWPALRTAIADAFRARTQAEWIERCAEFDACVAPVLDLTQARAHPHLRARGSFVEVEGGLEPAPAPRFSNWPR